MDAAAIEVDHQIAARELSVEGTLTAQGSTERGPDPRHQLLRAERLRDVVIGALIERGHSGAAYNVCRGEGIRLSDVVQELARRARVPVRIEVDPARVRPADVSYLVGDPSAIARDTGWRAEIPLDQTLDQVLAEWRERRGLP